MKNYAAPKALVCELEMADVITTSVVGRQSELDLNAYENGTLPGAGTLGWGDFTTGGLQ
jgi:hypothetical protein